MRLALPHVQDIGLGIGRDDKKRFGTTAHIEPFALADGEKMRSVMPTDDFPVGRRIDIGLGADRPAGCFVRGGSQGFLPRAIHRTVSRDLDDIPFAGSKALAEKLGQLHLSHKADALRILLVGRDQPGLGSDAAHLGLSNSPMGNIARESCSWDNWHRK